jgi:hypothetical protein
MYLSSRVRRAPREPFRLAGSTPNMPPLRASGRGTDNLIRSPRAAPTRAKMRPPIPPPLWQKAASSKQHDADAPGACGSSRIAAQGYCALANEARGRSLTR